MKGGLHHLLHNRNATRLASCLGPRRSRDRGMECRLGWLRSGHLKPPEMEVRLAECVNQGSVGLGHLYGAPSRGLGGGGEPRVGDGVRGRAGGDSASRGLGGSTDLEHEEQVCDCYDGYHTHG